MSELNLITDRQESDVEYLESLLSRGYDSWSDDEKDWFLNGVSRGSYDYVDYNRVTKAIEYLNDLLDSKGYTTDYKPVVIHHKTPIFASGNITGWNEWEDTTWIEEDEPTPEQNAAYLDNVRRIKKLFEEYIQEEVPNDGDIDSLTVEQANAIEQILANIEQFIIFMGYAYRHCGVNVCGIVGGLIK